MERARTRATKVFLAIKLPDRLKKELGKIQRLLDRELPGVLKFVKPDLLHITIVFLGSISEESSSRAARIIRSVSAPQVSFSVRPTQLGAFPRLARPSVIWIGLDDPNRYVLALMERMAAQLGADGIFPIQGAGRLAPHITLARVSRKRRRKYLGALKRLLESTEIALGNTEIPVRELVLYQTNHGQPGPDHLPLTVFPLTKSSSSAAARHGNSPPDAP